MSVTAHQDNDLLSHTDLARYLGVSEKTLERMVADRSCPKPVTISKQERWRWQTIRRWIEAVEFVQSHNIVIRTNSDKDGQSETN